MWKEISKDEKKRYMGDASTSKASTAKSGEAKAVKSQPKGTKPAAVVDQDDASEDSVEFARNHGDDRCFLRM